MSRAQPAPSIGIDFGTSNTVVALADSNGRVETLRFPHEGTVHGVYPSALCFWRDPAGSDLLPRAEGGPWAIARFLEGLNFLRFIQSFKSFAGSRAFQSTTILRQRYLFEDLLAAFLRTLPRHAGMPFDFAQARLTIGRPVRFAGGHPDDALAMARYRAAFERLGAARCRYVYEPVGAAFSFARTLDRAATVLIADFGGGTSDFSLMRFSRAYGTWKAEPLGHAGIGIAGDTFDARIIDKVVAPKFGKGGSYRSFGKVLPLPSHHYASLARWHELALLKGSAQMRDLHELARFALAPEPLRALIALIENDLGFALYRAVSAAKAALSTQAVVDFQFAVEDLTIAARLTRADFETWIAADLDRIGATVDQVLTGAGVSPDSVEKVFLTGGTSFVPAVQALFARRFGADRLTAADQFESIAHGLALIGQSADADQWAVAG